jgi:diaminopimelate decarboxylase
MKANNNLAILRRVKAAGAGVVVVSANELRVALEVIGFSPEKIVYNGNGKTVEEIKYAIFYKVLLSVDSIFDLENIIKAAQLNDSKARIMFRINPDIDPKVHAYVSTGIQVSKFGI